MLGGLAWPGWLGLAQLITALGTAAALVFTAQSLRATQSQIGLTEQGQLTDRFGKAVEQIGSDKPETRAGGIYALERLAHDSARDRSTIFEVLTAYIRRNAPAPCPSSTVSGRPSDMATDVQAALTVIRRRDATRDSPDRIDLRETCLRGADLVEARLANADLAGADLTNAKLLRATLAGADLADARLVGAYVFTADLTGVRLMDAELARADFGGSNLTSAALAGANLGGAHFDNADLSQANLERANLAGAVLARSRLIEASLIGADLTGASLFGADLSGADLTEARLANADLTDAIGLNK